MLIVQVRYQILRLTDGQGVDVIVDFVGQSYFEMNLKSELAGTDSLVVAACLIVLPTGAARDAHMVMLGLLSGGKVEGGLDLSTILYKRMRIEGTVSLLTSNCFRACLKARGSLLAQTLRSRSTEYQVNLLQRFSKEALPKVIKGHYELVLHKVRY